jgi:hypothetical protein
LFPLLLLLPHPLLVFLPFLSTEQKASQSGNSPSPLSSCLMRCSRPPSLAPPPLSSPSWKRENTKMDLFLFFFSTRCSYFSRASLSFSSLHYGKARSSPELSGLKLHAGLAFRNDSGTSLKIDPIFRGRLLICSFVIMLCERDLQKIRGRYTAASSGVFRNSVCKEGPFPKIWKQHVL